MTIDDKASGLSSRPVLKIRQGQDRGGVGKGRGRGGKGQGGKERGKLYWTWGYVTGWVYEGEGQGLGI